MWQTGSAQDYATKGLCMIRFRPQAATMAKPKAYLIVMKIGGLESTMDA